MSCCRPQARSCSVPAPRSPLAGTSRSTPTSWTRTRGSSKAVPPLELCPVGADDAGVECRPDRDSQQQLPHAPSSNRQPYRQQLRHRHNHGGRGGVGLLLCDEEPRGLCAARGHRRVARSSDAAALVPRGQGAGRHHCRQRFQYNHPARRWSEALIAGRQRRGRVRRSHHRARVGLVRRHPCGLCVLCDTVEHGVAGCERPLPGQPERLALRTRHADHRRRTRRAPLHHRTGPSLSLCRQRGADGRGRGPRLHHREPGRGSRADRRRLLLRPGVSAR